MKHIHAFESFLNEAKKQKEFEIEIINKNGKVTKHKISVDPGTNELFRIIEDLKKSPNVKDVHVAEESVDESFLLEGNLAKNFKKGDKVTYINPVYHKEYSKDISRWTNTPKNEKIPFEVYIEDGSSGMIKKIIKGTGSNPDIAVIEFTKDSFRKNAINTDKSYEISVKYLKL